MFSDTQLLQTVERSPAAVAAHDKAAWLALFSDDAEVHDPVGSRGHAGHTALERFYGTFIAPNTIRFDVEHDIVCGQTVVRDLIISTQMGGTVLQVDVPLFIRYEIVAIDGAPYIRRLYAHWELLPMMTQQLFRQGLLPGLSGLLRLSGNMLKRQGLSGALGFSRAFLGVGRRGKRMAQTCLEAIRDADARALHRCTGTQVTLLWAEERIDAASLLDRLPGLHWEKMLAGGRQVSVRLHSDQGRAVALFDFDSNATRLKHLRIYADKA